MEMSMANQVTMDNKEIFLARTQGFCAGVGRAVKIVEQALKKYGPPIYVFHEIVHNTYVVKDFINRGVIFVEEIGHVPLGEHLIFSAHGVSPDIIHEAKERNLICIDATCPLVKKIHRLAIEFSQRGYQIILVGHKGHQEIRGTSGYIDPKLLHYVQKLDDVVNLALAPNKPITYLTQTTLSVDDTREIIAALKMKYPQLKEPSTDNICFATQKRQDAVKELAKMVDVMIVCGSPNSSNSNRLKETGEKAGVVSYIIDDESQLNIGMLKRKNKVGISSGASVPWIIVERLVDKIQTAYPGTIVHNLESESPKKAFPLPEI